MSGMQELALNFDEIAHMATPAQETQLMRQWQQWLKVEAAFTIAKDVIRERNLTGENAGYFLLGFCGRTVIQTQPLNLIEQTALYRYGQRVRQERLIQARIENLATVLALRPDTSYGIWYRDYLPKIEAAQNALQRTNPVHP